jgi:hypothetical protein
MQQTLPLIGRTVVSLLSLALLMAAGASCSGNPDGSGVTDNAGPQPASRVAAPDASTSEVSPCTGEGCPCQVPGEIAQCRGPAARNGSYVYCYLGSRVCQAGFWGPCVVPKVY